jgi:hypothetical protein
MADATIANRRDSVFGDRRVILADITTAQTGDEWVTGLSIIDFVGFTPNTAITHGATFSGGTVTFHSAAVTNASAFVVGH